MKRLFQLASTVVLSALLTTSAFAATSFSSDMQCYGPGEGTVNISPNGTVQLKMKNLEPDTWYPCEVYCAIFGATVYGSCLTNESGRFSVTFSDHLGVCIGPVAVIDDICATGVIGDGFTPAP